MRAGLEDKSRLSKTLTPLESSAMNPISGDWDSYSNCGTVRAITARCGDETRARGDGIQSRADHHPCVLSQSQSACFCAANGRGTINFDSKLSIAPFEVNICMNKNFQGSSGTVITMGRRTPETREEGELERS